MKMIHTGDWHIGKLVHGVHMTQDQRYMLEKLIALIDEEKPDVLIIAGDVYDRSIPPVEAVELLDETLSKIIMKHKTQIVMIAGNHDSPDRVGFASGILKENGLHIAGNLEKDIEAVQIEDVFGRVNFYMVPYCEPAIAREMYNDPKIRTHDDAMKAVMERIGQKMDADSRNVCVAHAFVMGTETLETSESERPLSIGGSEYVSVDHFERFDYVALGHLHRPQKVKHEHIRYSGSLLKYSFSEALQKKSIPVIEMDGQGNVEIRFTEIKPLRDMRIIRGELENLTDKDVYSLANTDDYVMAVLSDRGELVDPIGTLRAIYPNIMRLQREEFEREAGEEKTSASGEFTRRNPVDLFCEFYENMSGEEFSNEKKEAISGVFDEINREGRSC